MLFLYAVLEAMIVSRSVDVSGEKSLGPVLLEGLLMLAVLVVLALVLMLIGAMTDPRNWF